jgi:hypothetical protein
LSLPISTCRRWWSWRVGARAGAGTGGALGAAAVSGHQIADLGQQGQLGVLGLLDLALPAEPVVREDDQEVDHRGDEDEVDGRRQQDVQIDGLAATDVDSQDAVVRFAAGADAIDQRLDDAIGELRNQRRECGADDHRDRQVDDIAPGEKLLEALQHARILPALSDRHETLVGLTLRWLSSGANFAESVRLCTKENERSNDAVAVGGGDGCAHRTLDGRRGNGQR